MQDEEKSDSLNKIFSSSMKDGYSQDEKIEDNPVFHYRKGSFRDREQKIYSDMATGKNAPKRGLFRVLLGTKGNRFLFFGMILIFAITFVMNILMNNPDQSSFSSVKFQLSAFSFEDTVYVSLEAKLPSALKKSSDDEKKVTYFSLFKGKKKEKLSDEKEDEKIVLEKPLLITADFSAVDIDGSIIDKKTSYLSFDGRTDFIRVTFPDYDIKSVDCHLECGEESCDLSARVSKH